MEWEWKGNWRRTGLRRWSWTRCCWRVQELSAFTCSLPFPHLFVFLGPYFHLHTSSVLMTFYSSPNTKDTSSHYLCYFSCALHQKSNWLWQLNFCVEKFLSNKIYVTYTDYIQMITTLCVEDGQAKGIQWLEH